MKGLLIGAIIALAAASAARPDMSGLDGHKAGDSWTTVGHNNLPMTMTVVKGQE